MKIRKALLSEANELSELALHSKATWNYSEEFILACKEELTITDEYIKNNFVYVLEKAFSWHTNYAKNGTMLEEVVETV